MQVRIAGTLRHSFVNGPGVRYVVFFQGCRHKCPGCHNPDTHDMNGGTLCSTDDIIQEMGSTKLLDGVTISGGDPLQQPEAATEVAEAAHKLGLSVWLYTGYLFEDIASGGLGEAAMALLGSVDVLVDGPYSAELKSEGCLWRGSTNQRLIDVPASLSTGVLQTVS